MRNPDKSSRTIKEVIVGVVVVVLGWLITQFILIPIFQPTDASSPTPPATPIQIEMPDENNSNEPDNDTDNPSPVYESTPPPANTPKETIMPTVAWVWSDYQVDLGGWSCGVLLFAEPLKDCVCFTLDYEFSEIRSGNPYGMQDVYIRDNEGIWEKVGNFYAPDKNRITTLIYLDSPTTFTGIGIVPAKSPSQGGTDFEKWFNPSKFVIN